MAWLSTFLRELIPWACNSCYSGRTYGKGCVSQIGNKMQAFYLILGTNLITTKRPELFWSHRSRFRFSSVGYSNQGFARTQFYAKSILVDFGREALKWTSDRLHGGFVHTAWSKSFFIHLVMLILANQNNVSCLEFLPVFMWATTFSRALRQLIKRSIFAHICDKVHIVMILNEIQHFFFGIPAVTFENDMLFLTNIFKRLFSQFGCHFKLGAHFFQNMVV